MVESRKKPTSRRVIWTLLVDDAVTSRRSEWRSEEMAALTAEVSEWKGMAKFELAAGTA